MNCRFAIPRIIKEKMADGGHGRQPMMIRKIVKDKIGVAA